MRLRPLGNSKIKVSAIALGTMNFGSDWHGVGALDDKTAAGLVDLALDSGVNLIDTADVYGRGASESMLGRILGKRRKKIILATKVCGAMRAGDPNSGGLSRKHITQGLDASLKRLKTDYVDLYMAHAPDPEVELAESLEAFDRAVTAGKVRAVGCSNFSGAQLRQALDIAASLGGARFAFNQVQYSLAARFIEEDLVPVCEENKIGILAWSPLGGGFLSGKYSAAARPAGRRQDSSKAFPFLPEERLQGMMKVLSQVATLEGVTKVQAALGWVLSKKWLSCAVVGARTAEQLKETLGARPLSARGAAYLDKASGLCLDYV